MRRTGQSSFLTSSSDEEIRHYCKKQRLDKDVKEFCELCTQEESMEDQQDDSPLQSSGELLRSSGELLRSSGELHSSGELWDCLDLESLAAVAAVLPREVLN
jgi:hypothetical protein